VLVDSVTTVVTTKSRALLAPQTLEPIDRLPRFLNHRLQLGVCAGAFYLVYVMKLTELDRPLSR
jgi:hypothetical protein